MRSADPTADKKQIWARGCAVTPAGAHYVTAEELCSPPLTPILLSGGLLEGKPLLSHPHLPMSPTNQSVWGHDPECRGLSLPGALSYFLTRPPSPPPFLLLFCLLCFHAVFLHSSPRSSLRCIWRWNQWFKVKFVIRKSFQLRDQ